MLMRKMAMSKGGSNQEFIQKGFRHDECHGRLDLIDDAF